MPTQHEQANGLDAATQKRDRQRERAEIAVTIMDRVARGADYGGVVVESVKFKLAGEPMGEGLVIFTGTDEDGTPVVAFHKAISFSEMFVGGIARLSNGTLKWRKDEYRT